MLGTQDEELAEQNDEGMLVDTDPIADETTTPNTTTAILSTLMSTFTIPLLRLITPTSLSYPSLDSPAPHPPTTSLLSIIHIRAGECLNNLFLSLSTDPTRTFTTEDVHAAKELWDQLWLVLSELGTQFGPGQERKLEMVQVAVGVLWGIAQICKGTLVLHRGFLS